MPLLGLLIWQPVPGQAGVPGDIPGQPVLPAGSSPPHWRTDCADCPQNVFWMGDQSLRLDSQGHPHLAYAGDSVYYAWYDGTAWHTEVVAGRTAWVEDYYQPPPSLA